MARLIADSEAEGIWTLQAGIFPENVASIALHERAGFRIVGKRERLGQMNGRWRDVVLMERRSAVGWQVVVTARLHRALPSGFQIRQESGE